MAGEPQERYLTKPAIIMKGRRMDLTGSKTVRRMDDLTGSKTGRSSELTRSKTNKFPLPSTQRLVGRLKAADSAAPSTRAPYPTFPAYSVSCEVARSSRRMTWSPSDR